MVFFCCSVCGESLKKNQVQKHYSRCRMDMVSCMDCSHEFWNDDYQTHTKCISEEEKYSGKDYKPRPGQNKGEVKQDAWLQQVQKAIDNCSPSPRLRNLLENLKDYPNIPRKQAKFLNFIKNSLRISDPKLANSVWDILMSTSLPKEENINGKENDVKDNKTEVKNGEKDECSGKNVKVDEDEEEEEEDVTKKTKKMSKREKKEERRKEQNKAEKKDSKKQKFDSENLDNNNFNEKNDRQSKKKGKKRKRNDNEEEEEDVYAQNGEKEYKKKKKSNKTQKDDEEDDLPPLEPNPNHAGFEDPDEEEEEEEDGDDSKLKKKQKKQKFNWEQIILSLLSKTKEKSMSEKKLRKKVLAEYVNQGCHVDSMSLLKAKFDRKIKKNSQLVRQKDQVKLID